MDLSFARLKRGVVTVEGDYRNIRIHDVGHEQELLCLSGNPTSGDYVIHLELTTKQHGRHERIYTINSEYSFKFLNRVTLQQSIEEVLAQHNISALNAGLYYRTYFAAYIHSRVVTLDDEASTSDKLCVKRLECA